MRLETICLRVTASLMVIPGPTFMLDICGYVASRLQLWGTLLICTGTIGGPPGVSEWTEREYPG